MSGYKNRWRAICDCGWFHDFIDAEIANGSANYHDRLKPGHVARVESIDA